MMLALTPACGVDQARSTPHTHRYGRADYVRFFRRPASFRGEELDIGNAEHHLTEACMARKGHHVRFAPATIPGTAGWVTPSLQFRRRHGYGWATFHQTPPDENVPTDEKGRDELAWKYFGNENHVARVRTPMGMSITGVEGCIASARRQLGGSVGLWDVGFTLPRDWSTYLGGLVGDDPAYLGAPMHRWARCMANNGYQSRHYRTLDDPYLEAYQAFQHDHMPDRPPHWEIRLALTDAHCQISTHLDTATKHIQDQHLNALPLKDRRHLRYIAEVRATVVTNARRILGKHHG